MLDYDELSPELLEVEIEIERTKLDKLAEFLASRGLLPTGDVPSWVKIQKEQED
jgi:hypothetical protein